METVHIIAENTEGTMVTGGCKRPVPDVIQARGNLPFSKAQMEGGLAAS